MRRRALAAAALALLAAGCGSSDERAAAPTVDLSKYGPRHAVAGHRPVALVPKLRPLAPGVARELRAGVVAVVAVDGTVGVRPIALEMASDARLERLSWSQWTASEAQGRGQLRVLDCQPTCASGHPRTVAATVRLSDVRTCAGTRYFGVAEVTVAAGEQPASYVRAPC
jgi:hypothetical protein